MGGISPAGRTADHLGYQRLVFDHISGAEQERVLLDLALLQGRIRYADGSYRSGDDTPISDLSAELRTLRDDILAATLIRTLDPQTHFDPHAVPRHRRLKAREGRPLQVTLSETELPGRLPEGVRLIENTNGYAHLELAPGASLLLEDTYEVPLAGAGQFPSGFNPQSLYPSKAHPRALAGSVIAASEAVHSSGLDFDALLTSLPPNQVSVYSGSAFGQFDEQSFEGAATARFLDGRVSSRHISFSLPEMSADFVNAYVLGATARVGYAVGACATFLYNLQRGADDIVSGRSRLAFVGGAECPLVPTLIDGLMTMGALSDWKRHRAVLGIGEDDPFDPRRISRPFCDNTGFTPGESCQFAVLMDDTLAVELGAHILGAAISCHTHADGYKQSISSPGVGNYLTVSQALADVRSVLGEAAVQQSWILAHGTSTPQNRVTESHILDQAARAFGIEDWPVVGIKAHLGHSMAAAAGDQLLCALGFWAGEGWLPGIQAGPVADDVYDERLNILLGDTQLDPEQCGVALLNSKGFGGNNATAAIASPHQTTRMLGRRHGNSAMQAHARENEAVRVRSADYAASCARGDYQIRYRFNRQVNTGLQDGDIDFTGSALKMRGFDTEVKLSDRPNPWEDMSSD